MLRRGIATAPPAASRAGLNESISISPVWEVTPRRPAAFGRGPDSDLRRTLAVVDVVAALVSLLLVVKFLGHAAVQFRPADVALVPLIILAAKAIGLYDRDQHVLRKTTIDEVPSIVYLSVLYALSAWLGESVLFHGGLGRGQVFALAVISFLLLAIGRSVARSAMTRIQSAERCLVLGNAADAARISSKLASSPGVKTEVVGRVALRHEDPQAHDDGPLWTSGSLSTPGSLAKVISEHGVARVIIAPDDHDQEEILHVIRLIKALSVKVSVLPRLLEVIGSSSTFEDVDGLALLGVRQYGVSKSSACLKRLMDVTGA